MIRRRFGFSSMTAKEMLMRYTPLAAAISLFVAVSASTSHGQAPQAPDPQVQFLLESGRTALVSGDLTSAQDRFEAALTMAPGYAPAYLDLAALARAKGLQGQAIHYYREALERTPGNLAAISGEGAAMAEKGAIAKAERNLEKLRSLCGTNCTEADELAAVIARGPLPVIKSAEARAPDAPEVMRGSPNQQN